MQTRAPRRTDSRGKIPLALRITLAAFATSATPATQLAAQDLNYSLPVLEIERQLQHEPFTIVTWRGSRAETDRTQRVLLGFNDSSVMPVKWATAPVHGAAFNNEPRYELAAYALQKLFLDPADYVVSPTVIRAFDTALVQERLPEVQPTFREAPNSVVVLLQYWLNGVVPDNFWDEKRAETDSVYARHIADMNILTFLIRHRDANVGNFLISIDSANPRVFSIDNGVSFRSQPSSRGTEWRNIRVDRLPVGTVDRLRTITPEGLERALGVLMEFEVRDGALIAVEPGPNMDPGKGIRRSSDRIQMGLTSHEIGDVVGRMRNLLNQVDRGRYPLF